MAQNTKKRAAAVDAVQMASAEIGHVPPQAPEVEEAVIGAMMLDTDSVYIAMESLKEKSFYDPKLRLIFAAITKLFHERSAIDMMTVTERLRTDGTCRSVCCRTSRRRSFSRPSFPQTSRIRIIE